MKKIALIVALMGLSSIALAQGMGQAPTFDAIDADGDGTITKEELAKVVPADRVDQRFDIVDADDDGVISKEEFDNRPRGMGGMGD